MRRIQGFKSQGSEGEDRISGLPDCVIQHIISFFPSTKQAIQTGILSKRWRNQWTRVPHLLFDSTGKSDQNFSQFIERTLILHNCSKIKKFQIKFDAQLGSDPQLVPKLLFATNKHVEELILHLSPLNEEGKLDVKRRLPKFLFSNDSLVKLELFKCYFRQNRRVNWPNLKELRLDCSNMHQLIIGHILPEGCPLLELLEITNSEWDSGDVIASKSLKKLTLIDSDTSCSDFGRDCYVGISCPNLEELYIKSRSHLCSLSDKTIDNVLSSSPFLHTMELSGYYSSQRLVIASKSLKKLLVGRFLRLPNLEISCPSLEVCQLYPSEIRENINEKSLAVKILRQLQHVKVLHIGGWLIQTPKVKGSSSLSLNCKFLALDGNGFDQLFPRILSLISCSPLLEKLVIKFPQNQSEKTVASPDSKVKDSSNSDGEVINCSVSNLKTVEIVGLSEGDDSCKLVFNFVECLLKNGRVLEKIVFILGECGKGFIFDVSKKLLSSSRYSPNTKIELI